MLQNQINPHFIYNTLNSIKWMATIQHAPGIAEMVMALSVCSRASPRATRRLVPLYEEFALLNDYFHDPAVPLRRHEHAGRQLYRG